MLFHTSTVRWRCKWGAREVFLFPDFAQFLLPSLPRTHTHAHTHSIGRFLNELRARRNERAKTLFLFFLPTYLTRWYTPTQTHTHTFLRLEFFFPQTAAPEQGVMQNTAANLEHYDPWKNFVCTVVYRYHFRLLSYSTTHYSHPCTREHHVAYA